MRLNRTITKGTPFLKPFSISSPIDFLLTGSGMHTLLHMHSESWQSTEPGRARRWNHFPNTIEGRYNQLSQTIDLEAVSYSDFVEAARLNDVTKKRRVFPLLWHELRHWIDHTSTVWGQEDLVAAYEAIAARSSNDETKFHKIVDYLRRASRDRFDDFYSVPGDPCGVNPPRTWKFQFSTGVRFDRDGKSNLASPILFATFRWLDDSLARRSPLSVAALLETAAMHFEVELKAQSLLHLADEPRNVQFQVLNHNLMGYLYNPDFTEYSVAVHVLANRLKIADPLVAFRLSAALSYVALNIVGDTWLCFAGLDKWKVWGDRVNQFIRNEDRGFAYFLLAHAAPKFEEGSSVTAWLEQTVLNAGLPTLTELKRSALSAMDILGSKQHGGSLANELAGKLGRGQEIFRRIGMTADLKSCISAVEHVGFPPILFTPDTLVLVDGREEIYTPGEPFTEWLGKRTDIVWAMDEFYEVCGL